MKLNTRTCDTYTRKTSPIFNIQRPVLFTSHSVIDDQPPIPEILQFTIITFTYVWNFSGGTCKSDGVFKVEEVS